MRVAGIPGGNTGPGYPTGWTGGRGIGAMGGVAIAGNLSERTGAALLREPQIPADWRSARNTRRHRALTDGGRPRTAHAHPGTATGRRDTQRRPGAKPRDGPDTGSVRIWCGILYDCRPG